MKLKIGSCQGIICIVILAEAGIDRAKPSFNIISGKKLICIKHRVGKIIFRFFMICFCACIAA